MHRKGEEREVSGKKASQKVSGEKLGAGRPAQALGQESRI